MSLIAFGAEITGVQRLKNRTVSFKLNTQELSPEKVAELITMADHAYVMFKPENFTQEEQELLESVKSTGSFGKTYSKRLRGVLYLNFQQDNEGHNSFEDYYAYHMEHMIDKWKLTLE